jgi:cytochrome c oxidase cbb3-type subunit 1
MISIASHVRADSTRIFDRQRMYSISLINLHFWLATIGTVFYIASMWVSGIMQGLMWRAVNDDGSLTYSFVEAVSASYPVLDVGRIIGGVIILTGMLVMAYNVCHDRANKNPVGSDTL